MIMQESDFWKDFWRHVQELPRYRCSVPNIGSASDERADVLFEGLLKKYSQTVSPRPITKKKYISDGDAFESGRGGRE